MSAVYLTPEQVLAIDEWLSQLERSTEPLTDVVIHEGHNCIMVRYGPVFACFLPDGTMIPEQV